MPPNALIHFRTFIKGLKVLFVIVVLNGIIGGAFACQNKSFGFVNLVIIIKHRE